MRTQRQVLGMMLAGLLITGSVGCQIVTQVDRKKIDGGAGQGGQGGGDQGAGGAGGQGGAGGGG